MRSLRHLILILLTWSVATALSFANSPEFPNLPCDPQAVIAEAIATLAGMNMAPPVDSNGNPYVITAKPHAPVAETKNAAQAPAETMDAPSSHLPGPSTITIYADAMAQRFGSATAICDPVLVAIVLHHEFQHTSDPNYVGALGDSVCSEWEALALTLELICVLTLEYQAIPNFPMFALCKEACEIREYMQDNEDWYMLAACGGNGVYPTIPEMCPDCECNE